MVDIPSKNPLYHGEEAAMNWQAEITPTTYGLDDAWSGVNSFISGIGGVGQTIYETLGGLKQAEANYNTPVLTPQQQAALLAAQQQRTQTYILIGAAVIGAILLLK